MVAPLIKALGVVVVGTPVAVVLGLTARSIRKQEDASVPVIRKEESPLAVTLYSNYLDKRTHEHLSPKSIKKGYVSYVFRLDNRTGAVVRGVHVELLDETSTPVSTVRVGEVEAHGRIVFTAKKAWTTRLEVLRAAEEASPRVVVTWRTALGRRRAISPLKAVRVLGEKPSAAKARQRAKQPVLHPVMS